MPDIVYNLSQQIPGFNSLVYSDIEDYKVIKYDKRVLTVDRVGTDGLSRSIIVNGDNQVVSFSPPKSLSYDVFSRLYKDNYSFPLIAQEFVEGTMINLFWDSRIEQWEISTRSTVGTSSSFYNKKTFRDMFFEAAINNNFAFSELDTQFCYSFVLQHPDNRIVVPFNATQLYLIAVYSIDNTRDNISVTSRDIYEIQASWVSKVKLPRKYEWESYGDLIERFGSKNTPFRRVGVVIYNTETGERTKIRNPVYEEVRHLRGNQPKIQYHYLCLRKEGNVGEFLKYFPENKLVFSSFRDKLHGFTNMLFKNYISCYIKKERPLIEFSPQFRTHMFNIHQIYTTQLKDKKLFVNNAVVIKYVNDTHPSLIMHSLNYQDRIVAEQVAKQVAKQVTEQVTEQVAEQE